MEYDALIIIWCALALLCGGLIKGTLGVGTPLLTVPLMALVIPPHLAVTIMAIPVVVANFWQASKSARPQATVRRFWPAFAAILAGTYIGVAVLATIDERLLMGSVGILVILFALLQGSSWKFLLPARLEKPAGVGFGFASGVVGGMSSMFGPMLIIYLVSVPGLDKDGFVGSISFLYLAAVVPWTLILILFGLLDWEVAMYSAAATLPVTLGMVAGRRLRGRISEVRFHRLVLVVLLASGGTMILRGVG